MSIQAYFREQDNHVPHGVKASAPRRRFSRTRGPWTVKVSSSCGYLAPHLAGSVKIELSHALSPDAKPVVKRFQVDHWREADNEITRLWDMLTSPVNKNLKLEDLYGTAGQLQGTPAHPAQGKQQGKVTPITQRAADSSPDLGEDARRLKELLSKLDKLLKRS